MGYITLNKGAEGIVELVFDQPGSSVNTMGLEYDSAMKAAVAEVQAMVAAGSVRGVYVRSGKPGQFFAGGDIKEMLEMDLDVPAERKQQMFEGTLATKAPLRTLETLGVPVAVGINGAALGGGFEIALACHHRIALAGVDLGLPEAQIGLMPGAGGVVRLTRLVGMQEAITLISQGTRLKAEKALEKACCTRSRRARTRCARAHMHGCWPTPRRSSRGTPKATRSPAVVRTTRPTRA